MSITVGSTSEYQWTAVLNFPGPGTYCYRVKLGAVDLLGTDASPRVTTAAAPGIVVLVRGVRRLGPGTTDQANVMSRIGASPASFVVTTGDNVYNSGTETEYGDLTQGNVFPSQYLPAVGSQPFFAAEGNHGFSTNLPYLQNFPAPTAAATSGRPVQAGDVLLHLDVVGAEVVPERVVRVQLGLGALLRARGGVGRHARAATRATSSPTGTVRSRAAGRAARSSRGSRTTSPPTRERSSSRSCTTRSTPTAAASPRTPISRGPGNLEGLLANNNVGIVFNGHAHHYERNFPQIPGKPLVSYVTGGGRRRPSAVSSTCSAFDAYAIGSGGSSCRAPQPASDANVFHFLLVTVNGNQVTVTPTDSTGRTFDVQTYTFSGGGGGDAIRAVGAGEPDRGGGERDAGEPGLECEHRQRRGDGLHDHPERFRADDGRRDGDDVHRHDRESEHDVHVFGARDRCRGQRVGAVELGDGHDAVGWWCDVHVRADG